MFVGRSEEQSRLEALIERTGRGQSSGVIVYGEPGVGKSTLLERAATDAHGFVVLRAHPLQAESELPFAGLSDLLRPILDLRDRIPERQRGALEGALALGPATAGDRFAVAAARTALVFTGRRLGTEGVALMLGMRDRDWLHEAGLPTLHLTGLAPQDAAALRTLPVTDLSRAFDSA